MNGCDKEYWPFLLTFSSMLAVVSQAGKYVYDGMVYMRRDVSGVTDDAEDGQEWREFGEILDTAMGYLSLGLSFIAGAQEMLQEIILGKEVPDGSSTSVYLH